MDELLICLRYFKTELLIEILAVVDTHCRVFDREGIAVIAPELLLHIPGSLDHLLIPAVLLDYRPEVHELAALDEWVHKRTYAVTEGIRTIVGAECDGKSIDLLLRSALRYDLQLNIRMHLLEDFLHSPQVCIRIEIGLEDRIPESEYALSAILGLGLT